MAIQKSLEHAGAADVGRRDPAGSAGEAARGVLRALRQREGLLLLAFVILALWFHVMSDGIFFTPRNLSLLLRQTTIVAIVASGVLILIVKSEIDLSIGSAVYLVSVLVAMLQVDHGWSTPAVVLAAIAIGMVLGGWNGIWVTRFGVPSFIVTLGGLLAFRGIGLLLTNANTIAPVRPSLVALSESFLPIPVSYALIAVAFAAVLVLLLRRLQEARRPDAPAGAQVTWLLTLVATVAAFALFAWVVGGFQGIPVAVLFLIGVPLLLALVLRWTTFGRYAYVIGSNRLAGRLAGIDIDRQILRGFLLMGVMYGVGGILVTARLGASTSSTGTLLELDAIAAAVLGGAHLLGGAGAVHQAVLGAFVLATVDNGMSLLNISSFTQQIVKALILLVAVASDTGARRNRS
jgi:D-xylose transport system permease protein